ncbi:hypothetical protein NMU03_07995 [Allocoprobacillus halotolerans]|uniref:Uncharacterized protein n=1 Tax=Allocoprobacillus halotolerans TaxID=2944914 RepID=A0ABY5I6I6_9FIRM|nr:hypothetical protein [Allocoprobacillus halotolerans]UTY40685.1 hypothetical protein NMU03_07995 [Allocoprobacillus halotolerans]
MLVERLNLETNHVEMLEYMGIVQFKGDDTQVDLTDGKNYYVVGIHNNLLKIIDDTQDYYYYLPFDAHDISKKEGIFSGFYIIEDPTGKINALFTSYKIEFDNKQKKNSKKLMHRIIQWKLNKK